MRPNPLREGGCSRRRRASVRASQTGYRCATAPDFHRTSPARRLLIPWVSSAPSLSRRFRPVKRPLKRFVHGAPCAPLRLAGRGTQTSPACAGPESRSGEPALSQEWPASSGGVSITLSVNLKRPAAESRPVQRCNRLRGVLRLHVHEAIPGAAARIHDERARQHLPIRGKPIQGKQLADVLRLRCERQISNKDPLCRHAINPYPPAVGGRVRTHTPPPVPPEPVTSEKGMYWP